MSTYPWRPVARSRFGLVLISISTAAVRSRVSSGVLSHTIFCGKELLFELKSRGPLYQTGKLSDSGVKIDNRTQVMKSNYPSLLLKKAERTQD